MCSVRKANRAAGCARGGGAGRGRQREAASYEQEATAVEHVLEEGEGEAMGREDEGGWRSGQTSSS
jgi:hypothetical protein